MMTGTVASKGKRIPKYLEKILLAIADKVPLSDSEDLDASGRERTKYFELGKLAAEQPNGYNSLIIDSSFTSNQMEGVGSSSSAAYIMDVWKQTNGGAGTVTSVVSREIDSDIDKFQIEYSLASAKAFLLSLQKGVNLSAGKKISFFIQVSTVSGIAGMSGNFGQFFGSGGSTTVTTTSPLMGIPALTDKEWFRFDLTVPSIDGKTIGADNYRQIYVGTRTIQTKDITFHNFECIETPANLPDDVIPEWIKKDKDPVKELPLVRKYFPLTQGSSALVMYAGTGRSPGTVSCAFTVDVGTEVVKNPTISLTNIVSLFDMTAGAIVTLSGSETISDEGFNGNSVTFKINDSGIFTANHAYTIVLADETFKININSRY